MQQQDPLISVDTDETTTPLTRLYCDLVDALQDEREANSRRLQIEAQIAEHPEVAGLLKPSGTSKIGELFEVTTKETRKWDQGKLADMSKGIKPEYWPFKPEFKEVRAESKTIESKFPDLWKEIREALTIVPAKTAVKPIIKG